VGGVERDGEDRVKNRTGELWYIPYDEVWLVQDSYMNEYESTTHRCFVSSAGDVRE
jgi:hypothetical protein